MADELDAISAIKQFSGQHQSRLKWWLAYAGDGQGNVYTSQANYFLVRYPLASSPTADIFNNRINLVDGLRIIVGYTAYQPNLLQVLDVADQRLDGVDPNDNPINPGNVGYSTVFPHWVNHQYLGADSGYINIRQLSSLGVFPTSPASLSVQIWPGTIPIAGSDANVAYQSLDLTASVPASGARYALISFDSTGAVEVTDGTINSGGFAALTVADIPDTPAGNWRSCAVALYVGQTAIVETNSEVDFLDLRFPEEMTLIRLVDAPTSYSGAGGLAVTVKADETGVEFTPPGGGGGGSGFVNPMTTLGDMIYEDTGTGINQAYAYEDIVNPGDPLVAHATATASSTFSATYTPPAYALQTHKTIDLWTSVVWSSVIANHIASPPTPWWKVDLGAAYTITKWRMIQLLPGSDPDVGTNGFAAASEYTVEYSSNDSTWTLEDTHTVTTMDETVNLGSPVSARYWRFTKTAEWPLGHPGDVPADSWEWSINFVGLYESSSLAATRLPIGSEGEVLTVSAGGIPEWSTASAGLPWFVVTDYGATGDGITDDTSAIQDAIDAAETAGGGVVYFPQGVYIVGGALQDGARGNAQLLLPDVDTTGEQISIILLGEKLPGFMPSLVGSITTPGVVTLKGTLNSGAGGALLGGWGPVGSYADFSLINVRIENLALQMPANPVLSALNLSHIAGVELVNVVAHTGTYQVSAITQPTTTTSYGIITPNNNNGAWTVLENVQVIGFYNGYQLNEHTTATYIAANGCYYAAILPAAGHAAWISRFLIQWCTYGLSFTGAHHLMIGLLNIEHHAAASVWYDAVYDIDDTSDYGIGHITYHVTVSGTGADDTLLINGGDNLHLHLIHDNLSLDELKDVDTTGKTTGDIIYNDSGTWKDYPLGIGSKITVSGSKIRFGNVSGGNYLEIDTTTGNLRLVGDATAWDDLRVEPNARTTGAKAPTFTNYKNGVYLYYFDDALAAAEKEIFFTMQMPHAWLLGSGIHVHVHWVAITTGGAGEKVRWGLEYTKADVNGVFGATTTIYATDPEDPPSTTPTADTHYLTEFAEIDMAGNGLSTVLICRLFRNSSNAADTYGGTAGLLYIDAHYQVDSFGSDEELVKDTSASLLLETGDILLLETGDRLLTE